MIKIKYFFCGHMDNMSYVIIDSRTKECVIVDPTWDIEKLLIFITESNYKLTSIWLTHAHYDHIYGLDDVLCDYKNLPIYVHHLSTHKFDAYDSIQSITDGDVLSLGTHSFQVIHTPGHSPDGVCFYTQGYLISGDTLFIDRCGRADLGDSNVHDLYHSLQRLLQLPDETVVFPGHNYGKTPTDSIGNQRVCNPYLLASDESAFIRMRMGR